MKTENWIHQQADAGMHLPASQITRATSPFPKKRQTHRKRHLAWEQAELASGGFYAHNFDEIARRYPTLTPMELRVCALVKALLPSWKIAELLGICEDTVENHRVNARRKMCVHGETLVHHLSRL